MDASTSSRYRITIRPRTSDCSAPAAMNSRPDIGTISAHGWAIVTHESTISPVSGSCDTCLACSCTLWRSDPEPTATSGHRRPANGAQERRSGLPKHIPMPRRLRHRDVALARPVAVLSFQLNKASGLDQPAHHRLAVTVQNRNGLAVRIQDHVTVSIEGKLIQPPRLLQPQPH